MERPAPRTISLRRRVQAAYALLAGSVGVVFGGVGFIGGLPQVLGAAFLLVPASWCVWMALGRRGSERLGWLLVAAGLGILSLWLVWLSGREVVLVFVGAALLVSAGGSAAAALYHVPRSGQSRLPRSHRRVRRPVLFVNPRSGGGTAGRVDLVQEARARGVEVVELTGRADVAALARAAVERGADCLGAAGGDGTLAQVASVAVEFGLPFVCVPAGTRNHFALDLGLDRADPVGALDAFVEAVSLRIDVAEVGGRLFLNNVSVGVYGEVVAREQYREHKIGTALSTLPELIGPDASPLGIRVTDENGVEHTEAVVLLVSNNAYALSPVSGFGSRPSLSDGRLGVVLVEPGVGLLGPFRVHTWETPSLVVHAGGPLHAGLDGESVELDPPLEFRVRSGVLRVRLPLDAPGAAVDARRSSVGPDRLVELWSVATGVPPG